MRSEPTCCRREPSWWLGFWTPTSLEAPKHDSGKEFAVSADMVKSSSKDTAEVPASPSMASSSRTISKGRPSAVTSAQAASAVNSTKFQNVHYQKTTEHWQAWTNCMPGLSKGGASRGPYCGAHLTENLAARAQDRALLKQKELATVPIKLNYPESDYAEDENLRILLTNKEFLELLKLEVRSCYKRVGATKCLQKFLAEEKALGNLPAQPADKVYQETPLSKHLEKVLVERPTDEIMTLSAELGEGAADQVVSSGEVKWSAKRTRSRRRLWCPLIDAVLAQIMDHYPHLLLE